MKRYAVKVLNEGKYKFYYILDNETYDVVLYPSKFLKHKIDANRSPNTVRRMAFALCYYMEYLNRQEVELEEVSEMGYEDQNKHFVQFLYWLLEGNHVANNRKESTGKGTCNAYFAVSRWNADWTLELISQALGHKHLDTTVKYLGILDDKLMEASREFYERHSDLYGIDKLL